MTAPPSAVPALAADVIAEFQQSLPKLFVFVGDKFLLDNRFHGPGFCGHAETIAAFNRRFGFVLLDVYRFGLYDRLRAAFPGEVAALTGRGIPHRAVVALLRSWIIGMECLLKRPTAAQLVPALELLCTDAQTFSDQPAAVVPELDGQARGFFDLLAAKNRKFAAEYILSRIREGRTIEDVYRMILLPALERTRTLWRTAGMSAADARTAEDICRYVMFRVVDGVFGERRYPFKALVACMQGEEDVLDAEVLANFLEIKGWSVSFLGHDASDEDILRAVESGNPQALVLSVATLGRLLAAWDLAGTVRQRFPQVRTGVAGAAVLYARAAFAPQADCIIEGFEQGHAALLALVIGHA